MNHCDEFNYQPSISLELRLDSTILGINETVTYDRNGFVEANRWCEESEEYLEFIESELLLPSSLRTLLTRLQRDTQADELVYIAQGTNESREPDRNQPLRFLQVMLVDPQNPYPGAIHDCRQWISFIAGKMSEWAAELQPTK